MAVERQQEVEHRMRGRLEGAAQNVAKDVAAQGEQNVAAGQPADDKVERFVRKFYGRGDEEER